MIPRNVLLNEGELRPEPFKPIAANYTLRLCCVILSAIKVRLPLSLSSTLTFIALNMTQHNLKSVISSDSHIYLAAIGHCHERDLSDFRARTSC